MIQIIPFSDSTFRDLSDEQDENLQKISHKMLMSAENYQKLAIFQSLMGNILILNCPNIEIDHIFGHYSSS